MKRTTLFIAFLFFLGIVTIAVSTSAHRRPANSGQSASAGNPVQAQRTANQNSASRRLPETRENFDIRAGRLTSLDSSSDALSEALQKSESNSQSGAGRAGIVTQSKLQRAHPGLQLKWDSLTATPSRIWSFSESLTPQSSADAEAIARSFLKENDDLFKLKSAEVDGLRVARRYSTDHNGMTHVTLGQQSGGLEVFQADLAVHVDRTGSVVAASGVLIPDAARKVNSAQPKMTSAEALRIAARDVDETITGALNLSVTPSGVELSQQFDRAAGFGGNVEARLVYFPLAADNLRLAWEFILPMRETPDIYLMVVDAERGSLFYRYNFTCYDENPLRPHGLVYPKDSPRPGALPFTGNINPPVVPREDLPFRAAPYNGREIFPVSNVHYDWWAGVPGNSLIGNNVDAHLDRDGTPNQPDLPLLSAPDGNFSFPVDFTLAPTTPDNQKVAQVNLFYWTNRYHDILYSFGFNEAAGNFQTNNFTFTGLGADAVQADAQDGGGTNNANFSTPPDGRPGRMQMYLWTAATPQLDGDLDQTIVLHELTHGLTNRLVFNATGLAGLQSGGMGEGWSDWFSLVLSRTESDNVQGTYPHGQYSTNNYPRGIRRFPYSNDPQVFPLTYKDVALRNQVHAIGEIWCNTLMEMRALLINRYGFQEGQRQSLQLVVDGLKLTPRSPTFVDARNAILLADRINNGSANQCLLWQAFAKRGLGFAATTTDASDGAPEESLAIAPYCSDAASIRFDKGSYISNETVRFWLSDRNATGTQRVTLTSSVTGDQENLTLTPEATVLGSFTGAIKLVAGRFRANDGVLQGSVGVADQIVVTYADANNGSDPATVRATVAIAREKSLFDDTIENGNQGWLPTGAWAVTNSRAASPIRSWTDSPAGIYANLSNTSLTSPLFDLSGLGEVILSFSHSYDIEQGFDFGIVEFSTDDGTSWKRAVALTGTQSTFAQSQMRLRALDGQARARIRFRLTTDNIVTADGWYVDDIRLTGRSTSPAVIGPDIALSPTITGISPAFGSPAGGTRVTILGSSFTETPDTTVFFDNLPATSVSVVSGNVISAVAPPHAAGPVAVRVGNRYGGVSLVKGFTYFVAGSTSGAPVVTNIYPAFGSIRGGTVVTMIGSNLTPETVVTFGAARGTTTFVNANTLRVVTPAATAVGATDVNIVNGASLSTLAGGFNFINPTPPVVDTILPGGGETIYAGGTINIRWRSSDNRSVARHSLAFRRVTGTGFALTDIAANIEGSAQSFAWTIPVGLTLGEGRIRVIATDDEGTETEAFSDANFTVARRWETSVSLPAPLGSFAAVSDGQNLYRIGGLPLITGAVPTATVQKLNPAAATPVWTDVAPLPTGLSLPDAVFLRGKIYVPGGSDPTGARLTTHFVYDVASNAWTTQASSPLGISSYVLAVDEARGVYYQTGGFNATSGRVSFVRMFNPATNAWSDLPPLLTARNFHEATLIDGKLYVAGGIGNTGALDSAEVYDFTTRQWTPIAPMNRPRSLATSFVTKDPAGNALWFVVGGNDTATGALLGAEVYDVRNNRWITLDGSFGLPTPRSVLSGAIVGGYFYAYGSNAPATGTANERFKVDVVSPIPLDPVPPALAVPPTQIAVAGIESRFDITANDLGSGSPITLTASGLPAGADFTTNTETNNSVRGEFRWTPTAADNGKTFAVSFTASDGQLSDAKVVNIRVVEASRLAAVNSADFRLGPIAPDSVASIFGTNLAVRTESASVLPLPRELAGTTVTVNGVRAALFVVSPLQINFAVPPGISLGAATIIVANQAGSYAAGTVEIAATAPALFTLNSTGTGDAWASATVDGINYQLPPFDVTVAGRPNILVLNGTGIRRAPATNPNDNDGVAESVTATIGGRVARVLYAGAQGDFTGLDQLNIEIPAGLAGGGLRRVEVIITVNGVAANRVMIQLK